MSFVTRLEDTILGWFKGVPHLPLGARKWLGENAWWLVLIGAIGAALAVLMTFGSLMTALALLGGSVPGAAYYVTGSVTGVMVFAGIVSLVFLAAQVIILGLAVKPLKERQKKGWVLLFASLLVQAVSAVVSAVVSLNILSFIISIIFGAIIIAIAAYFVFEIHGEFAHVQKSKGVRGDSDKKEGAKEGK